MWAFIEFAPDPVLPGDAVKGDTFDIVRCVLRVALSSTGTSAVARCNHCFGTGPFFPVQWAIGVHEVPFLPQQPAQGQSKRMTHYDTYPPQTLATPTARIRWWATHPEELLAALQVDSLPPDDQWATVLVERPSAPLS